MKLTFSATNVETIIIVTAGGAILGSTLGFMIAGFPGLYVGTVIGAVVGYEIAQVEIR